MKDYTVVNEVERVYTVVVCVCVWVCGCVCVCVHSK